MKHLEGLNEAQKQAVSTTEGPVLVLAGAGAGKTKTIAHRVVHLVKGGVPGRAILAITFTNKAAREMRERVGDLLKEHGEYRATNEVTIATFHALGVQLLREFSREAELDRHFTIFDRADSIRAIKRALKEGGYEDAQLAPRSVLGAISRAKGAACTLTAYRESADDPYRSMVASVWEGYQKTLRKERALDFDDLLLELWRLLSSQEEVRKVLAERYQYIHVDEYQDTNAVQYALVRLFTGARGNVFCVGDLDQNIYSWRGASIRNILEFEQVFPDAAVIRLEQNYRSTKTIIAVSNDIISKNVHRKEKRLFTENPEGSKLALITGYDEKDEANKIAWEAERLVGEGVPLNEIAVLYRANFQSRVLEDAFLRANVPYRVLGTRFFDRKEVKDTLTYLRAGLNPESFSDIERIINAPLRGIGAVTVRKLASVGESGLSGKPLERVRSFYRILGDIQTITLRERASEAVRFAIERSGLVAHLEQGGEEERERLLNMQELVTLASERYDHMPAPDGILRLIEDAALATDQDELDASGKRRDGVTLMTIHAAKGLEFSHVFIAGLEDGLFPLERDGGGSATADDEEERRLFYVALTRAKEKVHLSYAQVRTVFGNRSPRIPSEFLLDIDEEFIEKPTTEPSRVVYLD
jgi:DNA helicase II / ATP-dependent DNA helicase PcrA